MTDTPTSPWLHRWSVLTVCAAVVTMGLGSVVTNFKAGMADVKWPTRPDALLQMTAEQRRDVPLVIEHSHRAAAWVAGGSVLVLTALLWLLERRRLVRWLGTAALVGVSLQALLGGLRVTEDVHWGTQFKIFHGCFAPIVLALLVTVAVLTSRATAAVGAARLLRPSLVALAAVYGQIVLGVLLRHTYNPVAQRLHLLFAFAAALAVVWLVSRTWAEGGRALRAAAVVLACVLGLQLALGVEAWMTQLGQYQLPDTLKITAGRVAVRTAHVLGGSLLLAATVCVGVLARRGATSAARPAAAPRLGEAA
jgi:cytochrome c oxidase assembly protein subunit 15